MVQSMLGLALVEAAFWAVLLVSPRLDTFSSLGNSSGFASAAIAPGLLRADATASRPCSSGTVTLVVVMCVLTTVVEPAVATSKETRRARLHNNTGSL